MSTKQTLDELVKAAVIELFQARGVTVSASQQADGVAEYAAVIGFSGHEMRGMLGLGMAKTTLEELSGSRARGADIFDAEDWLRESSNQLLGRLKKKLLRLSVIIDLALPTVLAGDRLRLLASTSAGPWAYGFACPAGKLTAWLAVRLAPGVELIETDDPELQGANEGDLVLF